MSEWPDESGAWISALDAPRSERARLLHLAAASGHRSAMQLLVQHGVDVDIPGHQRWTPLHVAVEHHQRTSVEALLALGADVDARSDDGTTVLQLAIDAAAAFYDQEGRLDLSIVEKLLEYGANPDSPGAGGETPRTWAAATDIPALRRLFELNGR